LRSTTGRAHPSWMLRSRFAAVLLAVPALVVACTSGPAERDGEGGGALTELCPASACAEQARPSHECVGGVPSLRCNPRESGACRWQVDCVPPDPNAPPDLRGVSQCAEGACGAEPTWDPDQCVHGFVGKQGSCESIDRGPCEWRRSCLPKPCSVEDGTCNTLDRSRLGAPCGAEGASCPDGSTCGSIAVNIGERIEPVCISGDPCSALQCAAGRSCSVLESYPVQVVCSSN